MMPYLLPLEDNNSSMIKKKEKEKGNHGEMKLESYTLCALLVVLKCILNLLKALKII